MARKFENALVYRVAKSYYLDNLSQIEIAKRENISRSTVSRLLERARDSGVVCIEIKTPSDFALSETEDKLKTALHLREVIVVPASVSESSAHTQDQLIQDVASVAAAHLPRMIGNARTIGVGWGRTVYYAAEYLPQLEPDEGRLFVPLVSSASLRNRFLQTGENVSRYGSRFGGQTYYLNVSMCKPTDPRPLAEEYNVAQIHEYWNRLDAAVFSLGAPPTREKCYMVDELNRDMFSVTDLDPDAKAEILSQMVFADERPSRLIGRNIAIEAFPLEQLKRVPRTVLMAAGNYKAEPVLWAARKGYFNTLIVDHLLAEQLLRLLSSPQFSAQEN